MHLPSREGLRGQLGIDLMVRQKIENELLAELSLAALLLRERE